MHNMITVKDVSFCYEKNEPVLEHVNFSVEKGDFVAIIGSNGAGKSTLIKILLGQLSPTQGSVVLGCCEVNPKHHKCIGYVPQTGIGAGAGFPASVQEVVELNLYQEIGLFRMIKKEQKEKARKALAAVGMEQLAHRPIGALSGGQQQRVMIAKALVSDPELLILDEPTNGIDSESTRQLFSLLEKLNRERGITILLVTHDLRRVAKVANRFLLLEDGTIGQISAQEAEGR